MNISIIGAGLSGLLAASHFQEAKIYEKQLKETLKPHRALLRFRSNQIGEYLGIPFKEVQVNKAIYSEGRFVQPNPKICNQYALKVAGMICDRSIWNTSPCKRWIAPENLHEILLDRFKDRIEWNKDANKVSYFDHKVISTIPMEQMLAISPSIKYDKSKYKFDKQKIVVTRYRIPNCSVYQTIYFPDPTSSVYRASISGNVMIVEELINDYPIDLFPPMDIFGVFGISSESIVWLDKTIQNNGKIGEMDIDERKSLIYKLSRDYGVYSLGRFAIWKNILLDDVWQDIQVIKKLMYKNNYDMLKKNLG